MNVNLTSINPQITTAIADFGHSIGIDPLKWNAKGIVCLSFENFGKLYFEPEEDTLLIYLAHNIPFLDKMKMVKAFELTNVRENHPYPVQVGLRGQTAIVFCIRLPAANCQLHEIQMAAMLLKKLHERLQS